MAREEKLAEDLIVELLHNPWRLCTAEEIAVVVKRSINFVLAAKKAGAPFPGNVARPEWFVDWLKEHAHFEVKNASA